MLELILAATQPLAPDVPSARVESPSEAITFSEPVRLQAAGEIIRTESPGYASPTLHDVDGDGILDLAVGQFAGGKIRIYPGTESGGFAPGQWLEVDGAVAEVPGVW